MAIHKKDPSIKGIRVRTLNLALMVISCILILLVLFTTVSIRYQYKKIIDSMTDYSECNKAIRDIKDTSAYLTNQARLFSVNYDLSHLDLYLSEVNHSKRREIGLSVVELTHKDDSPDVNLKVAVSKSSLLETREMYAMKLICAAKHYPSEILPKEINAVSLSNEDIKLSDAEKIQLSHELLFNDEYEDLSKSIIQYTSVAMNDLVYNYLDEQYTSDGYISKQFYFLLIVLISLFIISVVLYVLVLIFILRPLQNHINQIEKAETMKSIGSYELKYIAKAYNDLFQRNTVTANVLKHKAEHDPLTGLINREAFDQIKLSLTESGKPIAYLIIDIDFFKSVNDKFGHLTGDDVLRNVSTHLQEQFRSSDYVARIGGDEFAVIMPDVKESQISNIRNKGKNLNKLLQEEKDGLPPVTLSIGVAFGEHGFNESLEKNADKALYKVKQNGRANISFFNKK